MAALHCTALQADPYNRKNVNKNFTDWIDSFETFVARSDTFEERKNIRKLFRSASRDAAEVVLPDFKNVLSSSSSSWTNGPVKAAPKNFFLIIVCLCIDSFFSSFLLSTLSPFQCDQMARLFFQHFAIYSNENLPNRILLLPK